MIFVIDVNLPLLDFSYVDVNLRQVLVTSSTESMGGGLNGAVRMETKLPRYPVVRTNTGNRYRKKNILKPVDL